MTRLLGGEDARRSELTTRRIDEAAEDLLRFLFFSGEAELSSRITASSAFAEEFSARGPRDGRGRGLRQLSLDGQLLEYRCSYLVYTESFNALPAVMLGRLKARMLEILEGRDRSPDFQHLSDEERMAILEILEETHPLF